MLVNLFRERRNAELALTRDVTGRNLPSAPCSEWTFVKALEIKKYRVDPAELNDVVRQLEYPGYCIFAGPA
jgi:hypothetical protein